MTRILPDLFYLLVNSVGRAALGATIAPGLDKEWRESLEDHVAKNGKLTKFEAGYTPIAPPPVFWEYNCGGCIAFERETSTCKWVKEEGFPNPGIIHPQGWCAVFMPPDGERPLSWVGRVPWFVKEKPPALP